MCQLKETSQSKAKSSCQTVYLDVALEIISNPNIIKYTIKKTNIFSFNNTRRKQQAVWIVFHLRLIYDSCSSTVQSLRRHVFISVLMVPTHAAHTPPYHRRRCLSNFTLITNFFPEDTTSNFCPPKKQWR